MKNLTPSRHAIPLLLLVFLSAGVSGARASSVMTVDAKGGVGNLVSFVGQYDALDPAPAVYWAGTVTATLNGGPAFDAYCVDLFHTTYVGGGPSAHFLVDPLPIVQLDGQGPAGATGGNGAGVAYLYDKYAPLVAAEPEGATKNIDAAALQVAIWKAEYDNGGPVDSGHFTVWDSSDPNSNQHKVFAQATADLSGYDGSQSGAATWLQAIDHPIDGNGVALNQNLIGPGSLLPQVQVSPPLPTPEPTTLVLAGMGTACLAAHGWRSRKRARPLT